MARKPSRIGAWIQRKIDAQTSRAGRNASRAAIDELRKQKFFSPAAKAGIAAALLAAGGAGGYALGATRRRRIEKTASKDELVDWNTLNPEIKKFVASELKASGVPRNTLTHQRLNEIVADEFRGHVDPYKNPTHGSSWGRRNIHAKDRL